MAKKTEGPARRSPAQRCCWWKWNGSLGRVQANGQVLERELDIGIALDSGEVGVDSHAFFADLAGSPGEARASKASTRFTTRLVPVLTAEIVGQGELTFEKSRGSGNWVRRNWFTFGPHCVPFLSQNVLNLQVAVTFFDTARDGAWL
ncbi:MAG: hypothetical protein AB1555_01185 [Nitrospirota bacterium]